MPTTDAAAMAAHLDTLDKMEQSGARLLDAGANPARMAGELLCVVLRLQVEGKFGAVDVALIEDVFEQIVSAQENEGRS